jgi:hypothetical protein
MKATGWKNVCYASSLLKTKGCDGLKTRCFSRTLIERPIKAA